MQKLVVTFGSQRISTIRQTSLTRYELVESVSTNLNAPNGALETNDSESGVASQLVRESEFVGLEI